MTEHYALTGFARRADRAVDPRRAARVMGVVLLIVAAGFGALAEHLLASADAESRAGAQLRAQTPPSLAARSRPARVALVLVDGLRVDEARALPSIRRLAPTASVGTITLSPPTLSRPFEHVLLTGVPSATSGVRSNRFTGHARHDSVADRVRAAGGSVSFVSDDLDWLRRMHGQPGDGGSDARGEVERLGPHLERLAESPAPALLLIHTIDVDHSAHMGDEAGHRAALAQADAVIAQVAAGDAWHTVVLSDHGHVEGGGHGGPEPSVARAPLYVWRAERDTPPPRLGDVDSARLAATLSALLGVGRPLSAVGPPLRSFAPGPRDPAFAVNARAARLGVASDHARLTLLRSQYAPVVALLLLMALGPVKRAFGFDRSVAAAILLFPLLVIAAHLALGRPLSLSGIDARTAHVIRVLLLGGGAAAFTIALTRAIGRGARRTPRVTGAVAWSATVCAIAPVWWAGFALGPWTLSPLAFYAPLLGLGAGAGALIVCGVTLLGGSLRRGEPEASPI